MRNVIKWEKPTAEELAARGVTADEGEKEAAPPPKPKRTKKPKE